VCLIRAQCLTAWLGFCCYENTTLAYFDTPEGRVLYTGGKLQPQYIITDQQGNARVTFVNDGGTAKVIQENSYYAFGLVMTGGITPTDPNRNLYNGGSEWQNDFGDLPDLMQTYYRNYDQALGRWTGVDPDAEGSESLTSYNYSGNNPVMFNDPLGNLLVPMEGFRFIKRYATGAEEDEAAAIEAVGGAGAYYTPGYIGYLKDQVQYANNQKYWETLFHVGNQLSGDGTTFTSSAISQMYSPNGFTYWTQTGFAYYKPDNSIEAGVVKTPHIVSFSKGAKQGINSVDWNEVGQGAFTFGAGIYSMATGVGNVYAGNKFMGAAKIIGGFGSSAFGLARTISGLHGQTIKQYGGLGDAIDSGLGGTGTIGQTVDILSGGNPSTVVDVLVLFKSINDMFGPHSVNITTSPGVMQQDHTRYTIPLLRNKY
jgi:RHS repeat-associated protein